VKLIAQRKFFYKDSVRGRMASVKVGEEFELSVKDDSVQIFEIISSCSAYPIESEFVPLKAKYLVFSTFDYQEDGETKQAKPQEIITLSREEACRYMGSGHARPVDVNQWNPKKLLEGEIRPGDKVKQMFDSEPAPKPNWATGEHHIKGGHE
jgi:hypothetical protein